MMLKGFWGSSALPYLSKQVHAHQVTSITYIIWFNACTFHIYFNDVHCDKLCAFSMNIYSDFLPMSPYAKGFNAFVGFLCLNSIVERERDRDLDLALGKHVPLSLRCSHNG